MTPLLTLTKPYVQGILYINLLVFRIFHTGHILLFLQTSFSQLEIQQAYYWFIRYLPHFYRIPFPFCVISPSCSILLTPTTGCLFILFKERIQILLKVQTVPSGLPMSVAFISIKYSQTFPQPIHFCKHHSLYPTDLLVLCLL